MARSQECVCPWGKESMLSSPRIKASGGMKNVGPVPKAGCTSGIGGIAPVGNTDTFQGTRSGWFYPIFASLLARQDSPLTV